jgi:hypothetical protein
LLNVQVGPGYMKKAREICHEAAKRLGHDVKAVPVMHRDKKLFRHWDLKGLGGDTLCEVICNLGEWRIASPEEAKVEREKIEKARRDEARKRLRIENAAVEQLAANRQFQTLVEASGMDTDALAQLSPEDLKSLREKIDSISKGKK